MPQMWLPVFGRFFTSAAIVGRLATMNTKQCDCGCGQEIPTKDDRGRARRFVSGHGNKNKSNVWKKKPESVNKRTGRYRARLLHDCSSCELIALGGCSGRIEIHHKDSCPTNNTEQNRIALCTSHHRLVENGRIDLAAPVMPQFVIRGGKRRYLYAYTSLTRSEGCQMREAKKRQIRSGGE